MAIVKSQIFGPGSKGSIGNVTLRTTAGRVIASDKISAKGGLGTRAQVVHQTRMANIMQAFRELAACGNGNAMAQSFPGRDRTMSNANMFMRVNMAEPTVSAVVQSKLEAANNAFYAAPFIVSRGNLVGLDRLQALFDDGEIEITVPTTFTATLGNLSRALMDAYDLREFDTVTFFAMNYSKSIGAYAKIDAFQLIIDTASTETFPSWIAYEAGTGGANGHVTFTFGTVDDSKGCDIAIVQGRNTASGYEVSNSQFTSNMLTVQPYLTVTGNRAEEDAAQSYGYKDNPYLQASTANPQ